MKANRWNGGNSPYAVDVVVRRNKFVEFALLQNPPGTEFDRNWVRTWRLRFLVTPSEQLCVKFEVAPEPKAYWDSRRYRRPLLTNHF